VERGQRLAGRGVSEKKNEGKGSSGARGQLLLNIHNRDEVLGKKLRTETEGVTEKKGCRGGGYKGTCLTN